MTDDGKPDDEKNLDRIWARYADGERLTADDAAALLSRLAKDPDWRRDVLDDAEMHGRLRGMKRTTGDEEALVRAVAAKLPAAASARRSRFSWLWPALAGAAATAAVAVLVVRSPRGPAGPQRTARSTTEAETSVTERFARRGEPSVEPRAGEPSGVAIVGRATGRVRRIEQGSESPVVTGAELGAGQGIVTGADGAAVLTFPDGTELAMSADTVIAQMSEGTGAGAGESAGKRVFLALGELRATVARQSADRAMVIATPTAEATVRGTKFSLSVDARETRIEVTDGLVHFASTTGQVTEVSAGASAIARKGAAPVMDIRPGEVRIAYFVGPSKPDSADALLISHLEKLGYSVRRVVQYSKGAEAEVAQAQLVLISATVAATDFKPLLRDVAVPVMTWESWLFDDLGMTGPCEDGNCGEWAPNGSSIASPIMMKDTSHPMAAGLTGELRGVMRGKVNWGTPGVHATWVATLAGEPDKATIFAYERGAEMVGVTAPARRVGFFLWDHNPTEMTPDGWRLFDAAVAWCAADRTRLP